MKTRYYFEQDGDVFIICEERTHKCLAEVYLSTDAALIVKAVNTLDRIGGEEGLATLERQAAKYLNTHERAQLVLSLAIDLFDNRAEDTYDDEGNPTEELNQRVRKAVKAFRDGSGRGRAGICGLLSRQLPAG
jgi:hypothetical protein